MEQRDKWNLVHRYRTLVALDVLPPVKCPECQGEMVPVVDTDDNPALQCFECASTTHIGLHVYDQMKRNIKEVEDEIEHNRGT